jgi:thiamine biosynthesis lipoprotein
MGTTYHVKVVVGPFARTAPIAAAIEKTLEAVNAAMSTYRPDSEISRFNDLETTGEPFPVSAGFYRVMEIARDLHRETGGAWDGTIDPLVNLWGFGRSGQSPRVPADERIRELMDRVGFGRIALSPPDALVKDHPEVTLDLASIAKGYGVDAVAGAIAAMGHTDYLVEVGGEVYAAGRRPDGSPWRVGINVPEAGAAFNEVYKVVTLTDRAFATSGDYRNFFEAEGRRYSHVLDPRTGYPVANGVVSASVVADNCTLADGLATALMVMGPEAGVALVERLAGVECFVVTRDADGRLRDHASSGIVFDNP